MGSWWRLMLKVCWPQFVQGWVEVQGRLGTLNQTAFVSEELEL